MILAPLIISLLSFAASPPTPAEKAALVEMENKIKMLKAAGALPEGPEPKPVSKNAMQINGCVRLTVGQAAVIAHKDDLDSPTGTSGHYGLSRQAENLYLAELRLRFEKGRGYPGAESAREINDKYLAKVGSCFKEYSGKLKNEKTNQTMEMRLTDNPSLPEVTIQIMPKGFRTNRFQYASELGCAGILHETLHLLGLSDEYPHKPSLTETYLDCRPASPRDSIMGDDQEAVKSTQPQMGYSIEKCKCDKPGVACWELAMKSNGKTCPAGSVSFFDKLDPKIRTSLNVLNNNENFVLDVGTMKETGLEPAVRGSILYPAHFRAITEPGCRDVNEKFYACSQNAYRFSKPSLGRDLGDPSLGCKPTPEECRWRSFKWLE